MKEIRFKEVRQMLQAAADEVIEKKMQLSALDASTGDGDHGSTIVRIMEIMLVALEKGPQDSLKVLMKNIGWDILGVSAGATGPLLGSLFIGLSEGMADEDKIDAQSLPSMFKAARDRVLKVSGASIGDKTMIDVLIPAIAAIEENVGSEDINVMLDAAAEAAEKGAESTINMKARKGRARNVAERSVGCKDPGATSLALIFKGLSMGARG